MADDPIVPNPNPEPPPAPSGSSLTCEFCDCVLARNGQVLRVGKRAKSLRDSEDVIETHLATIRERDASITELNRTIDDLRAQLPKESRDGGW